MKNNKVRDTYAIGDIHGNYKGLIQAIKRSPFNPTKDRLITLGDYIDGGNHIEVLPVIDYLMSLPNWVGIKGNHCQFAINTIQTGWKFIEPVWYRQGGRQTLDSMGITTSLKYNEKGELLGRVLHTPYPRLFKDFLDKLILYFVDESNNAYVHAGWSPRQKRIEDSKSYEEYDGYDLYWNREFWLKADSNAFPSNPYNKVFIGHTQSKEYPLKRKNVWNLDSAAGLDGCITIMNVKTEKYWQSDSTPDLYSNFGFR